MPTLKASPSGSLRTAGISTYYHVVAVPLSRSLSLSWSWGWVRKAIPDQSIQLAPVVQVDYVSAISQVKINGRGLALGSFALQLQDFMRKATDAMECAVMQNGSNKSSKTYWPHASMVDTIICGL